MNCILVLITSSIVAHPLEILKKFLTMPVSRFFASSQLINLVPLSCKISHGTKLNIDSTNQMKKQEEGPLQVTQPYHLDKLTMQETIETNLNNLLRIAELPLLHRLPPRIPISNNLRTTTPTNDSILKTLKLILNSFLLLHLTPNFHLMVSLLPLLLILILIRLHKISSVKLSEASGVEEVTGTLLNNIQTGDLRINNNTTRRTTVNTTDLVSLSRLSLPPLFCL